MDLSLSRHFLHGTERGGEDLYLRVEITEEDERKVWDPASAVPPVSFLPALEAAFDPLWERLALRLSPEKIEALEEAGEDTPEDDTGTLGGDSDDELWVEDDELRCRPTPNYDFEMALSKEDAWEKVQEIANGEWFKSLKTGVCQVSGVVYVDGNAE